MKVSWVRLSGHAFFSEPVTPVSRHGFSQYVTQFLSVSSNNIIHIVLLTQVNSSIVSDLLYIRSLTDKFSFSIMLSAAF